MSITPDTMAAIQHAGQALDSARAALQQASQQQSARVAEALSDNPFGLENDAHFEHWKSIARMAQALQAMEEQMKTIFQTASEIAFSGAVPGPASRTRQPLRLPSAGALDIVEAVPAKGRRSGRAKPVAQAAKPQRAAKGRPAAPKGNAARVLAYLSASLNRRGFKRVTHGEIVDGAGIPMGSVGAALAGLLRRGLVREGERGCYQLA